jgi:hypothetical protein
MTRRQLVQPLAAALLASVCVTPVFAQSKTGPNKEEKTITQVGPVGTDALAYELYAYGVSVKDPLAVATAAAMIAKNPPTETKREKTVEGGPATDIHKQPPAVPDVAAMIETARSMAGNNSVLRGIIDDVAAAAGKGNIKGPQYANSVVRSGTTDNYTLTMKGAELAEVLVRGDGDTVLHFSVLDEFGNVICDGDDSNGPGNTILHCRWKPRWTGPFKVRIRNTGRADNAYRIETN